MNVLLNLTGLLDFTVDMVLEELRFIREHQQDFGRVAIVSPEGWVSLAAHIAGLLSRTNSEYFDTPEDALAWVTPTKTMLVQLKMKGETQNDWHWCSIA